MNVRFYATVNKINIIIIVSMDFFWVNLDSCCRITRVS